MALSGGAVVMLAGLPLIFAVVLDDYTAWLWWSFYLILSLVGAFVSRRRRLRASIARWLTPRLPRTMGRVAERTLFFRPLWVFLNVLSLIGVVLLTGSLVMFLVERDFNPHFGSLDEASHSTLIYLFSGVEDRTPKTEWGWRVVGLMVLSGVGLTAYATGHMVHEIIGRREKNMERDAARECYLIIGWNPRAHHIIEELFMAFEAGVEKHLITVLSETKVNTAQVPELDARGVTFLCADPNDKKVLEKLGAHEARSVIVMANLDHPDPDARAALIVLALRGLFQDKGVTAERRPRITVEVTNHRRTALIRDAGADETVCHEDYGLGVLVQASLTENVTEIYHDLLTFRASTNEMFLVRNPTSSKEPRVPAEVWDSLFQGKTFAEAAEVFGRHRHQCTNPAILVGIRRAGKMLLNPTSPLTLDRQDDLIVMAREVPAPAHLRQLLS